VSIVEAAVEAYWIALPETWLVAQFYDQLRRSSTGNMCDGRHFTNKSSLVLLSRPMVFPIGDGATLVKSLSYSSPNPLIDN
jgi:hypothetical protein